MKADFHYSTDFQEMNAHELSHTCMHLLCMAGEGSFVFNERCYHIVKNDLVVIPMPDRVKNLAAHADLQVEWFAADYKFLQNLLPSNNYSIGGSISLNQDPIIKLSDEQAQHLLDDFHRLPVPLNKIVQAKERTIKAVVVVMMSLFYMSDTLLAVVMGVNCLVMHMQRRQHHHWQITGQQ